MISPTALAVLTIILVQGHAPAMAWNTAQALNFPTPNLDRIQVSRQPQARSQSKRSTTFRPVAGRIPGGRRPGGSR